MGFNIYDWLLTERESRAQHPWKLWEKKTFNMHRGVIEWDLGETPPSIDAAAQKVRQGISREFRPGWLRGFGFGTIFLARKVPEGIEALEDHIDRSNRLKGTWQWAIVCMEEPRFCLGVHTWLSGYLGPVFESVLAQASARGYEVAATDLSKGPLMELLDKVDSLRPGRILGRALMAEDLRREKMR